MNTKFTAGPWTAGDYSPVGIPVWAKYGIVATCQTRLDGNEPQGMNHDVRQANARLIAAAPELLQELRKALEIIEGEYPANDEIAAPVIASIKAAIAKATD